MNSVKDPSKNKSLRAILSLSRQSVAYGVGMLGSQLIIYVMLPFLTRYMPQEEYGVVSVITALYAFLNMLTNAGLPAATFRYYNETADEKDRRVTVGASQLLFFLFAFIPALLLLLFAGPVSILLLNSDKYSMVLRLVAGYLVVDSMNTFGTVILRIEVRPLIASIHSIILITCRTGLALLFVIGHDMGVFGYWLGHLIGEAIGLALMIWFIRRKINFEVSWGRVWALAKFGFPLIPATLSMTILRLADRYIIGSLAGLDQVAIYDVGYKVGSIIVLLIAPFRTAWIPYAFSIAQKPDAQKTYRDVLTYLTAGCIFLILGVITFRVELVDLIAPVSYAGAVVTVGWVAASQLFLAVYHIFSIGPMVANKTRHLAWVALAAGGINMLLNILLIPSIGILGAGIATFAGYLILATLTYLISRDGFAIPIDWKRLSRLLLASVVVALAVLAVENISFITWSKIVLKAFILTLFPIILLIVGFVSRAQGREALNLGRSMMKKRSMRDRE
jgi:O-antigen/teichoic acid export membrane protein